MRRYKKHPIEIKLKAKSISKSSHIIVEEHASVGDIVVHAKNMTVGAYTYIRSGSVISANTRIGRFCSIAKNVVIGVDGAAHPLDWLSTSPFQYDKNMHTTPMQLSSYEPPPQEVVVGNDIWIGEGARIMAGVTIGDGAVIAAYSLVTKDVPNYAIVGGMPAKVIKYRFPPEMAEAILNTQWWQYETKDLLALSVNSPMEFVQEFIERNSIKTTDYKLFKLYRKMRFSASLKIRRLCK